MKRITEFEALRGFLALWVVIGHVLKKSAYTPDDLGGFALLAHPGYAVDVFIALSGFVIFNLLDQQRPAYATFITQRFFRLYPLYLVVLAASVATATTKLHWLEALPWSSPYVTQSIAVASSSADRLADHTIAHLTMLHGLVPDFLLPFSEYALVGQAWSISVEWQFYLVAPLLLVLSRRSPLALAGVVLAIIAVRSRYWLGEGFAVNQSGFFIVGIASYYIFSRLPTQLVDIKRVWLSVVLAIAVVAFFLPHPASMALWFIFLGSSLATKFQSPNLLSRICGLPLLQWLGRISYSIYLVHMLVLEASSSLIFQADPAISKFQHVALAMPLTLAGTLALSAVTYALIERPGIELGRQLSTSLQLRRTPQAQMTGSAR